MALTQQEVAFIESIKNKIKDYGIKTTVKEAISFAENTLIETTYNDKTTEIIDVGVERFLCGKSPNYFINRYCYVSVPNIGIIPFSLYYFQSEVMKEIFDYKKYIFLKTRQCGISTVTSFYCLWRCLFRNGEDIAIVSKRKDAAQDFITKMKVTLDYIPTFLRQEIEYDNMSSISFKNNSRIKSEARSPNAGRSGSLSLLVLDEAAFYGSDKMARDIVASAMPTLTRTGGSLILISTPNGMHGEGAYYFEQVQQLKSSGNTKTDKLVEIDWYEVPDIEGVSPAKGYNDVLLKYIKKDYFHNSVARKEMREYFKPIQEKWKENEWLKAQYNTLQDVLFKQEILHDFITMGSSVFSKELLERVFTKVKDPVIKNTLGNSSYDGLWIWKPPMAGHRYLISCLPTGEKVLTNKGLKNIEEVSLDDKLYGKNGNELSIVNKQIHSVKEEDIYKIKIRGIYDSTGFTGEHPLLISKHFVSRKHGEDRKLNLSFKFEEAKNISPGDWVVYPNVYNNETITEESMIEKFNIKKSGRYDFDIDYNIILEEDFWWYVGIWLAEGWVQENGFAKIIATVHNFKTEKKYGEKILKLFNKYGRKVSFIEREKDNSFKAQFVSSHIGSFLINNFGKGAINKNIPEWIKFIPKKYKIKMLEGYFDGDGGIINEGRRKNIKSSFVSISKKLLKDIQDILFSIGITSSMILLRNEGISILPGNRICKTKKTYALYCGNNETIKMLGFFGREIKEEIKQRKKICQNFISEDNKYIYLRVSNIEKEKYTGKVYNFETEDHTFLCNYLTTHNCDVATGTGNDFSALQVFDVGEYEQVAEYYGHITTPNYAFLIKKIASYYNQGYVVIESNSIGEAVFNQIYYNENEAYRNMFKQEKSKNGISRMTGWITDVKTRKLIVNELIDWISVDDLFNTLKIYSSRLHNELTTWIWQNDKAIHTDSAHDDLVIAMALALYLRNKATQSGVSFMIAENGNMLAVTKEDSEGMEDPGMYGLMCDSLQDKNDFIQEKYNMDLDTYAWLSK